MFPLTISFQTWPNRLERLLHVLARLQATPEDFVLGGSRSDTMMVSRWITTSKTRLTTSSLGSWQKLTEKPLSMQRRSSGRKKMTYVQFTRLHPTPKKKHGQTRESLNGPVNTKGVEHVYDQFKHVTHHIEGTIVLIM